MFSHPWTDNEAGTDRGPKPGVLSALRRVRVLNDQLKERSRRLLAEKKEKLQEGGGVEEFGSCDFNVALINRMEPSEERPDLKLEPTFGQDR